MRWTLTVFAGTFGLSGLSLSAHAYIGCFQGETEVSRTSQVDKYPCRTRGRCFNYGVNPINGNYEYFYGEHNDCPGQQARIITTTDCRRSDGSRYRNVDVGPWSNCVPD